MATAIEVRVLGPFRVLVDGEDRTEQTSASQRAILALLAAAGGPVPKSDVCRVVSLARSSLDPQLSKLRAALGIDRPLHRSRIPGPGSLTLDPAVVSVDADDFVQRVVAGAEAHDAGRDDEALATLLAADDLWRGPVFDGVDLLVLPGIQTRTDLIADRLAAKSRRCRDLAAWCWLGGARRGLSGERLRRWAEELRDDAACWAAATRAALERDGVHAAADLAARWRERASVDDDAAATAMYWEVIRLLDGPPAGRVRMSAQVTDLMRRAEASHLAGEWDEAERLYRAAADDALAAREVVAEAEVVSTMARITWDPARFGGGLEARILRLLDDLPDGERVLRARLLACLAGGLYQDGSVDVERTVPYAREALELASELDDPLTAAEVLSHARKSLIDVDPPTVQLERARWIISFARTSDYHRSLGLMASIVDLLLLARLDDAREATEDYREIAERTRSDFHRYYVAALDGMWALHDGRFDDVERWTTRAEELGGRFGGIAVAQVVEAQRLWSGYLRGDADALRPMLPLIDAITALDPPIPVWETTGAMVAARMGDDEDARARLDRVAVATNHFRAMPRGPLRIAALAVAARTCADLAARGHDVRSTALGVHEELVRHSADGVLVGWPAVYMGAKQSYVELAATAGRTSHQDAR